MLQKILLICVLFLAGSCSKPKPAIASNQKTSILVSIAPYRFLTEQIAGKDFDVQTVVPPNANPHTFEPTPRQAVKISQGQVWFQIGEPFESKILPILKSRNPNLVVKDLREGIAMIEEGPSGGCCSSIDHMDRHIWLSPKRAMAQAAIIEKTLSETFPEHKELFQNNLNELCAKISSLDEEIQETLKDAQCRSILVSHPAFGYFCSDYGFTQISVEFEGKDPRPKHLEKILLESMNQHTELALALPQYNNKGIQLIAKKLDASVHFIDPYSSDYLGTLRKLTSLIKEPHAD